MTQAKPELNRHLEPTRFEDIETIARRIETAAQQQVAADIDRLKAMSEPIYYQLGNQLIREESDGRKFEYRLQDDGREEIIGEIF